jgi:beta-galactosidase
MTAWPIALDHLADGGDIDPPRVAPDFVSPTQQLDFSRFSSDELLECYRAEREILRRLTPGVPVTTNFMTPAFKPLDYFDRAPEQDCVSTDHYLRAAGGDTDLLGGNGTVPAGGVAVLRS